MQDKDKSKIIFLLLGVIIGMLVGILITSFGGILVYKTYKHIKYEAQDRYEPETAETETKKILPKKDFFLSFEDKSDMGIFESDDNAAFEIQDRHATHGKYSLVIRIDSGMTYPGIVWETYGRNVQNWKGGKDFHFDVYNDTEEAVNLTAKFKSGKEYPKKSYSRNIQLEPLKTTHVSIPLSDIAANCDITQMSYVKLYVYSPKADIVLFIDNMGTKEVSSMPEDAAEKANTNSNEAEKVRKEKGIFAASSLDRVFKDGKTLLKPIFTESASISLAKNEYESFQIVVNSGGETLKSTRLELSDLIDKKTGGKIGKENITWRIVGYIPTVKPYYPVKYVGLWPDPLMPGDEIDIEPGVTQPFWITVYIPKDAKAGDYKGSVKVLADNMPAAEIPVSIHIYDFTLPLENKLKTAFDFYGHITHLRYPQKPNESNETYGERINNLNDKYIIDMLKHRINPILNIDPLSEASLGKIDIYRRYGLNNFSIGKKGGTFGNNWPKTDEEIEALLPLYRTYGETLKINHMMEHTYIYTWDEGKIGNPEVAKICSMVHRAHPELKNMVCYHGFWDPQEDPEWGRDIDIWCFQIEDFDEKKMRALQYAGKEIWVYISGPGGSGYPNLAIDYDSIDYRMTPWLCWRYDIKGLLYWCVNWWPDADPFKTGKNTKWEQNGNGLLYYPGEDAPLASLRLEILRDGIEDYEYLYLLNQMIKSAEHKGLDTANEKVIAQAKKLLDVTDVARSMTGSTRDSEKLFSKREDIANTIEEIERLLSNTKGSKTNTIQVVEDFSQPLSVGDGRPFGEYGQLTFELYRGGNFAKDKESGALWQKSASYRDSAIIRSTNPLPPAYKISAVVGDIDYGLDNISGLGRDPEYSEGPPNENGCYLLAITDVAPIGNHTNDWWHEHRKVCIDVDNNVWGHGMPNPIFMVYFDNNNDLASFNGATGQWEFKWINAVTYEPSSWYKVEIEKTRSEFIMRIYDETGGLLKEGRIDLAEIWNEDGRHPDYLVIGDPHENYYQGSMRIKSISMPVEK